MPFTLVTMRHYDQLYDSFNPERLNTLAERSTHVTSPL